MLPIPKPDAADLIVRFALILDFVFTLLSFRVAASYGLFKKLTYLAALPKRFVHIGVVLKQDERRRIQGNLSLPTLAILTMMLFGLIIFAPDMFWAIASFPFKIMGWGVTIWQVLSSPWYIPLNILVSYLCFLSGVILTAFAWGFVIAIPVRTLACTSDMLYRRVSKKLFEVSVIVMFIMSWLLTYWSLNF